MIKEALCPLDCPDGCSLEVELDKGRVTRIGGSHRNEVTQGFICAKVRRFPEMLYGKDRVDRPYLRQGTKGNGDFAPISWDEALDRITDSFRGSIRQHGGEAILPLSYGGSNGFLSQNTTDARLFRRLGASRLARTVCAAPTGAVADGMYGKMPGVGYPDYEAASLIVVWGANPHATGIHLLPYIKEARDKGAKLLVVDPRETPLAKLADLHLPVIPGTDVVLALSMIRWLYASGNADTAFLEKHARQSDELQKRAEPWTFERAGDVSGCDPKQIEQFVRGYAEASPAVLRCGWGLERNRNGGSAVAAVLALPAVAGKFGVRGGGYTMSNSGAWGVDTDAGAGELEAQTRIINMNKVGEALCHESSPPITSLFVYNHNPIVTLPNQEKVIQGFLREDLFTVVFDSFWTDSARLADLVLPATTFLERKETARGYGSYALQTSDRVADVVGESRTNHEVFLDLCDRLGLSHDGDPRSEKEVETALFSGSASNQESLGHVREEAITYPEFGMAPIQFENVLPRTVDQKIHLVPASLDAEAPDGLYAYRPDPKTNRHPLGLISPASKKLISSTFGQLYEDGFPLKLHPHDAEPRQLKTGDEVRVYNDLGEVRCTCEVTETVRPGVVSLAKGIWFRHTKNDRTSNVVSPDTLTDIAGGACFNDARVEVEGV